LRADEKDLVKRFIGRGNYSKGSALRELRAERDLYSTDKIEKEAR